MIFFFPALVRPRAASTSPRDVVRPSIAHLTEDCSRREPGEAGGSKGLKFKRLSAPSRDYPLGLLSSPVASRCEILGSSGIIACCDYVDRRALISEYRCTRGSGRSAIDIRRLLALSPSRVLTSPSNPFRVRPILLIHSVWQ